MASSKSLKEQLCLPRAVQNFPRTGQIFYPQPMVTILIGSATCFSSI